MLDTGVIKVNEHGICPFGNQTRAQENKHSRAAKGKQLFCSMTTQVRCHQLWGGSFSVVEEVQWTLYLARILKDKYELSGGTGQVGRMRLSF